MRRVIEVIFESFNRHDCTMPYQAFDNSPCSTSSQAMYYVQTGMPPELKILEPPVPEDCLAARYSTRLYSSGWPRDHWAPNLRSGKYNHLLRDQVAIEMSEGCEPNEKWSAFANEVATEGRWQHLIYWTLRGHLFFRDKGFISVPDNLQEDCRVLWALVNGLSLQEDDLLLVHNDHGTARKNQTYEQAMFDGFLVANHDVNCGNYAELHQEIKRWLG